MSCQSEVNRFRRHSSGMDVGTEQLWIHQCRFWKLDANGQTTWKCYITIVFYYSALSYMCQLEVASNTTGSFAVGGFFVICCCLLSRPFGWSLIPHAESHSNGGGLGACNKDGVPSSFFWTCENLVCVCVNSYRLNGFYPTIILELQWMNPAHFVAMC